MREWINISFLYMRKKYLEYKSEISNKYMNISSIENFSQTSKFNIEREKINIMSSSLLAIEEFSPSENNIKKTDR